MSIPRHYGDSIFRDGNTILRNGLEVHVYFRGYFPMVGLADDSGTESVGGVNLADIPQYPYYHAFHGVITGVSHEYSGGYYSASLTCSGMLHFWQYMQIASNGSYFGARPNNSAVRPNLKGHVFTGMSPFAIIYSLYKNTMGAAAGVGFALQSRTNMQAISTASGDTLYSMALQYWERRFLQGMYGLRMHGASGQLFSGSTQAYLARLGGNDSRLISVVSGSGRGPPDILAKSAAAFNLIDLDENTGKVLRGADVRSLASSGGGRRDFGVNVVQMQAFVNDISQYGQVNLFETTYETKLDIATQVSNICGYEFYQDMDGDLVFKPPLYNLDTSSSRIYRLEPEDIISISFTESEPEATYATVKGGPFQNMRGAVDEAEFGVRGTYYDYRLIAQFGWREGSMESNYYSNARSAFYAAVANLDRLNQGMNSASVTIPLRPEIRQGFPVYIPHIDCFYYVQSVSHAFTFGSGCTTTLNLIARRRKFIPPGDPNIPGVTGIKLEQTTLPPKSLQYLDNSGIPRVLGFPNVVLALDPERINPLFFVLGLDSEEDRSSGSSGAAGRDRRDLLASNFAQLLVQNGILAVGEPSPATTSPPEGFDQDAFIDEIDPQLRDALGAMSPGSAASLATPGVMATVDSETPVTTHVGRPDVIRGPWVIQTSDRTNTPVTPMQLSDGLTALITARTSVRARLRVVNRDIRKKESELQGASAAQIVELTTQIGTLRGEAVTLNEFLAGEDAQHRSVTNTGGTGALSENGELVNFLIGLVRQRNPNTANRDMSVDPTGSVNDSATLLDMLGDRKASIGLNTPGYYRYYSSAHPDPDQQGYIAIPAPPESTTAVVSDGESLSPSTPIRDWPEDMDPALANSLDTLNLDGLSEELSSGTEAVGVVAITGEDLGLGQTGDPADLANFVSLVNKSPVNGLNVRTFASQDPTPTPTDQIFALSFEQRVTTRWGRTTVFVERRSVQAITDMLLKCLSPSSPLGDRLGLKFLKRVKDGAGSDSNAAETGGALVARATGQITDLVGGDNTKITSADIAEGTVNILAMLDGALVTDVAVGPTNTPDRVANICKVKGNALIQQVSKANESRIQTAIRIIQTNPATTAPGVSTISPPVTESDSALASRVSSGHSQISAQVLRAIRVLESGGNPRSLQFESRLFREATGITVSDIPGENARVRFNRMLRDYPAYSDDVIRSTSFGLYQVLGNTLIAEEPSDPVGSWDRNPENVSNDLLVRFLDERPAVRSAMETVTQDPSQGNINSLARVYNGARVGTVDNDRWSSRFTSALNTGVVGRAATGQSGGRRIVGEAARQLAAAFSHWKADLLKLFDGDFPSDLPFGFSTEEAVISEPISNYAPVFPVSDAVGYEHYGTYQYGRGLSIEPGGNYEKLMGTDPFQYVDATLAQNYVDAVRRSGSADNTANNPEVRAALTAIASDAGFANSPGAAIALRIYREDSAADLSGDRTAMLTSGLANYVMSDRDAITKLPVSNAAFRLADLNPNITGEDTCECRGAEADLLLGAYMRGANETTFAQIETTDEASQWVANQMVLAADSWTLTQNALRGAALSGAGRKSVFDSVQGILGIASQVVSPFNQLESDLNGVADPSSQNLRRLNQLASKVGA
jgi:hypothetical protein